MHVCDQTLTAQDGDAAADTYEYESDADAAACDGDERRAQQAIVPPDPRSLAQASPRISSFCVSARVPFVYKPSVNVQGYPSRLTMLNTRNKETHMVLYSYSACFVNTLTLNMYVSMSYSGVHRRNTLFVVVWLRHRNT